MRNFFRLFSIAMTITLIAALSAISFQPAAADERSMDISNNVIFISDSAATDGVVGDGSSPDKPLDAVQAPAHLIDEKTNADGITTGRYYYNTALYQAAEKLANTGGTIVICGDVKIGADQSYGSGTSQRDFEFPLSDKNLCITSVYDGVDYRTSNGAEFILESPAQITLNSPTIFEKILIHTNQTTERVICANANRLIMGEDITYPSGLDEKQYISVAGGSRYSRVNGDTDLTVKSGYYYMACGSSWGAGSGAVTNIGNVNLTLEGGTFRQEVTGGIRGNASHLIDGDVTISIYPNARLGGGITVTGKGGFATEGNEATINIYGGWYYADAAKIYNAVTVGMGTSNTVNNYKASKITLNLSNASSSTVKSRSTGVNVNTLLDSFITTASSTGVATQNIVYPAAWATTITPTALPSSAYVLENEAVSSKGAALNVTYTNPVNSNVYENRTVVYSSTDLAFKVNCNTTNAGTVTAKYLYGSKQYHTQSIEVLNVPKVNIIGAKIKSTDKYYQGLKFIAYYTNETLPAGMSIADYGLIGIPADLCPNSSALNFEDTYGMSIVDSTKVVDKSTIGNRNHFAGVMASNLKPNQYNVDYHARAYLKLSYKGDELYVYSDIIDRNPYEVAEKAIVSGLEKESTVNNLRTNVIEKFDNYDENTNYVSSTNLRTKVVNAMKAQMNILWTPSQNFWIYNDRATYGSGVNVDLYFEKGKVYRGIPYTNMNFSQKETFSEFLIGNTVTVNGKDYAGGTLEVTLVDGLTPGRRYSWGLATEAQKKVAHDNYNAFPGSDCSTAVITSWNTVINNRVNLKNLYATKYMIPGQNTGTLPVGSYDYSYEKYGVDTHAMCKDTNNAANITASYALLQPGDAIVAYKDSGHTRMVVENDPANKKLTTIECANWDIDTKTSEGFWIASWKKLVYTYDTLLDTGYIPITIPELVTGCSDGEYTYVTDLNLEEDLAEGKLSGKAISNRQVISVDITVTNVTDGTAAKTIKFRPPVSSKYTEVHVPSVDLSQLDLSGFGLASGKTYTMSLDIRVAGLSDANPTVKLIKDYQFTVK